MIDNQFGIFLNLDTQLNQAQTITILTLLLMIGFGNLVREILQNSLDAALDGQSVRVEFRTFKTKTSAFPGLESFKQYLQNWKDTQIDVAEDDKDYLFVNRALEELSKDEMAWLRISDFNTTVLCCSTSKKSKTPYFSFVHGAGKNSKQSANAGVSKGVGKTLFC